jgi:drug/metabolite transporter (DMT)-like permease
VPLGDLKHHLHLHFIILIFGFTGILGEMITLDALSLVWYRTFLAVIVFMIISIFGLKGLYSIPRRKMMAYLGVGVLVAAHWITFFHAIKISSVSLTLACLAATPFFTSLLEPLYHRRPIQVSELLLGVFTVVGISIIFQVDGINKAGMAVALTSGFLAACFSVLNGKLVHEERSVVISFWELTGAVIATTIFIALGSDIGNLNPDFGWQNWILILILAIVCTNYAMTIAVHVMKYLSPFTVVLSINMEPVYGILLAFLIFGESERMAPSFYLGAVIIMGAVFANVWLKQRRTRLVQKRQ